MGKRNHYRDTSFSRGSFNTGKTEQHLKDLGAHVLDAAKAALKQGADEVVAEAKNRCPTYEGHKKANGRTYWMADVTKGALRDSIKAEPKKNGTVYEISANAKTKKGFLYGQIVEFSPNHGHPFLYPAMDAKKDGVRKGIIEAIKTAIRRGVNGNSRT
jgi:hypothetical protein